MRKDKRVKYRTPKGVQDILPPEVSVWQKIENVARRVFSVYGYQEIRPPIIEFTELFVRGIGEETDIVEKEMYTFQDRAGRSITLRPEGTASVVRAYIQHHLYNLPSPQRFYYMGPMFRYERPQKGRYRQFHQIGVECFGEDTPRVDAELMHMLFRYLEAIGLRDLSFEINSIGCRQCRPRYREKLLQFLSSKREQLCTDCLRRYSRNPLRVLDCKVPECIEATKGAPAVTEYLCANCQEHFGSLKRYLEQLGLTFRVNPRMVRGLDYYTRTTFEVLSSELGAQNAVAAGGRYDDLVEEFGGPPTPAIGFAVGVERLATLIMERADTEGPRLFGYFATLGERATEEAMGLASRLRDRGLWVEMNYRPEASLKSQLRKANRMKAMYVFILGEEEIQKGVIRYKRMDDGFQSEVKLSDFVAFITGSMVQES